MLITMQGSIWITTMLLHILLFAITTLSQFTTPTKLTKLTLNLTHNQSPYSLLLDTNMSTFRNGTSSLEDIRFPLTRRYDYMLTVPITLGTPPISLELLMDTGSSLTWTQCEKCYKQKDPIYNPEKSKTYRKLPGNATCSKAQFKPFGKDCIYQIGYGGGTIIKGFASYETFSFENGASARQVMPNIMFGCSNSVKNAGPIGTSELSGIMGLNRSPQSLLTQLFPGNKRRLSYCFSPFAYGIKGIKTVMTFGDDVPKNAPALQTSFRSGFPNYYLDLEDISVGNLRLGLPIGTFAPSSRGAGGFMIDSGTLIPIIQKKGWFGKPYSTVIAAFKKYYNALGLKKIPCPEGMVKLDLCYKKPIGFNKFATMTYHFKGANYVVDGKYTSIVYDRNGFFCVAVMPKSGISILGNWHQQNMRLVYDVSMGVLRFGAEECAK